MKGALLWKYLPCFLKKTEAKTSSVRFPVFIIAKRHSIVFALIYNALKSTGLILSHTEQGKFDHSRSYIGLFKTELLQ